MIYCRMCCITCCVALQSLIQKNCGNCGHLVGGNLKSHLWIFLVNVFSKLAEYGNGRRTIKMLMSDAGCVGTQVTLQVRHTISAQTTLTLG